MGFSKLDFQSIHLFNTISNLLSNINITIYYEDNKKEYFKEAHNNLLLMSELGFDIQNYHDKTFNDKKFVKLAYSLYNKEKGKKVTIDNIKISRFFNCDDELKFVARKIKKLYENKTIDNYSEIAIICNDINSYKNKIEEIFSDYNIPFYLENSDNLISSNLIKNILNIIKLKISNYNYKYFIEILNSPYIFVKAPDNIDDDVNSLKYYINSVLNRVKYYNKDISEYFVNLKDKNKSENIIQYIKHFKSIIDNSLPNEEKISTYIINIKELLVSKLNIVYNIYKNTNNLSIIKRDSISIEKFLVLLDKLVYTFVNLSNDKKINLSELYLILLDICEKRIG